MRWCFLLYITLTVLRTVATLQPLSRDIAEPSLQQRDNTLPSCSASCIETLAPKDSCTVIDTRYLCPNSTHAGTLSSCVTANCSVVDALATQRYQAILCGAPIRDQGELMRRTWCALFSISIAAITLRFAARAPWLNGPGFGWDDWTMLVVLAFLLPHEIGLEIMIRNGLGQDLWMLTPNQITTNLKFFWTGEMYYTCVVMFTKVAILFLYLRIFPSSVSSYLRTTCFVLIGACISGAIGMVLALVFECDPVTGAYNTWDGEHPAQCVNINALVIAMAVINILLDLTVFFLPIPKIVTLHVSKRKKVAICVMFLIGLFVTGVSIVRLVAIMQNISRTNATWDLYPIAIWTQAEVNGGVLCACIPCFAGFIKRSWTVTVGRFFTGTVSELSTSRTSPMRYDRSQQDPQRELQYMPSHGVAKTVDASVVLNQQMDLTYDIELMDHTSQTSQESRLVEHNYGWDWI